MTRLFVYCGAVNCNHSAVLDGTSLPDDLVPRSLGLRIVCKACGYVGAMYGPIGRSAGISRTLAEPTSRMGDSRCKTDGKQNPTGFHDL